MSLCEACFCLCVRSSVVSAEGEGLDLHLAMVFVQQQALLCG